jgi:hypothetical protein
MIVMNVREVLAARHRLWGSRLTVSGTLRVHYNSSRNPPEEDVWIMPDPERRTDFKEAIFIDRDNLVRPIIKVAGIWFGRYMFNHPVVVTGTLQESSDPRFLAALGNVVRMAIEVDGKEKEVALF